MDLGSKGLFAGERSGVKNHKNLRLRKKLINECFTIVNVTAGITMLFRSMPQSRPPGQKALRQWHPVVVDDIAR